jgi:hypothetical protein
MDGTLLDTVDEGQLRELLLTAFNKAELETLCAKMSDELLRQGEERLELESFGDPITMPKEQLVTRLMEHARRRDFLSLLVHMARAERPEWNS